MYVPDRAVPLQPSMKLQRARIPPTCHHVYDLPRGARSLHTAGAPFA